MVRKKLTIALIASVTFAACGCSSLRGSSIEPLLGFSELRSEISVTRQPETAAAADAIATRPATAP